RHLLSPLENQSHDLLVFLCALLAIDALCASRPTTAGVVAGLGAALKATPLLFMPLLLWQRRFTAAVVLGLSLTAFPFVPDLLFPAKDHGSWTVGWYRTFIAPIKPGETAVAVGAWYPWNMLNQSLAGTTYRLFTPVDHPNPEWFDVSLMALGPRPL